MHTTIVKDDDDREWVINHNGDWSGEVFVSRSEDGKIVEDYKLPGAIIRKACAGAVVSDLISIIEQWDGSDREAQMAIRALTAETRAKRP
jgi:hypothetical protein